MMKKAVAMLALALTMVATTGVASASDLAETNATDKVECLFRVYIQEGGEQGLECLI